LALTDAIALEYHSPIVRYSETLPQGRSLYWKHQSTSISVQHSFERGSRWYIRQQVGGDTEVSSEINIITICPEDIPPPKVAEMQMNSAKSGAAFG